MKSRVDNCEAHKARIKTSYCFEGALAMGMRACATRGTMLGVVLGMMTGCFDGSPSSGDLAKPLVGDLTLFDPLRNGILGRCMPSIALSIFFTKSKVTRVEKNECVKASGKPGYVCTFAFDLESVNADGKLIKESGKCEARFVKGNGDWSIAVDL